MSRKTYLLQGVPVVIISRRGDRVLVRQEGWPFPISVDIKQLTKRMPAPFVPGLF